MAFNAKILFKKVFHQTCEKEAMILRAHARLPVVFHGNTIRHSSTATSAARRLQALTLLGLDESSTPDDVKLRFSKLARIYHPDTGGDTANAAKFVQIRSAFRLIMDSFDEGEASAISGGEGEEKENKPLDIKHTAPQHRQYLEYEGIGVGTPFARQKQYQQYRVYNAVESAAEFALNKAIAVAAAENNPHAVQLHHERNFFAKKHKLTGLIDRVVEDMIVSSMREGHFSNLKGTGQPLKQDFNNPYIDESERRINDVLKNNGFIPPWITKESDVREGLANLRQRLRKSVFRRDFLEAEANDSKQNWSRAVEKAKFEIDDINKQIRDYNLICPVFGRQFMLLTVKNEVSKAESFVHNAHSESQAFREQMMSEETRRKQQRCGRESKSSLREMMSFWKASFG